MPRRVRAPGITIFRKFVKTNDFNNRVLNAIGGTVIFNGSLELIWVEGIPVQNNLILIIELFRIFVWVLKTTASAPSLIN